MCFSSSCFAGFGEVVNKYDFDVKFGGWSYHVKESYDPIEYNEVHSGLGLEWNFFESINKFHNVSLGYFTMKDSFGMRNNQAGIIYSYSPGLLNYKDFSADLNIAALWMRRGWLTVNDRNYTKATYSYRDSLIYLPYITLVASNLINLDLMYIPQLNEVMPKSTYFIRVGVNLNRLLKE